MSLTRLQKIFLGFIICLSVVWGILFTTGTTQSSYNYLYSFLINIIPFIGGIFVMSGSQQWRGEGGLIHKGLFFIGLGLMLWASGGFIWSYYNVFLHTPAPYPSLADLGYAPSVFFYSLGAIYLSRGAGADLGVRKKYAKLLIILVPLCMLFFSYYMLIHIARQGTFITPHDPILKSVLDFAYPFGDFFSLTSSIILSGLYFEFLVKKYKYGIFSVLFGLCVMFAADFAFSFTTIRGTYFNGNFGDFLFSIGMFLLAFGALFFLEPEGKKQYESKMHLFRFLMYTK